MGKETLFEAHAIYRKDFPIADPKSRRVKGGTSLTVDKSKPMLLYRGGDGCDYATPEELLEANRRWVEANYPKITRNPRLI